MERARPYLPHAAVFALAVVLHLNSLPNDLVWDDVRVIRQDYRIKDLRHIPSLFLEDYYQGSGTPAGNYRPLVLLGFSWEYALYGPRPWGFRLGNLMLHGAACVLVLVLLRRLVPGRPDVPVIAAALFAAHAVHTEAVSVITGRGELLVMVFLLGAWIAYLGEGRARLPIALGLFFLGLLSKENASVFPGLLAIGAIHRGEPARRWLRDLGLALLVFGAYVGLRLVALGSFGVPEGQRIFPDMGLLGRAAVGLAVLKEYVLLSLLPVKLSLDYQFLAAPSAFSTLDVAAGGLCLAGLAAVVWGGWRSRSPVFLAAAIFLVPLVPVLHVLPIGELMGERLLYLPSLGFCLGVALVCDVRHRVESLGFAALIVAALGLLTMHRNVVLRDQVTAAAYTLEHYPRSYKSHVDVAAELRRRAARSGDADPTALLAEARDHYRDALWLRPDYTDPKIELAAMLREEGRYRDATERLYPILRERPEHVRTLEETALLWLAIADSPDGFPRNSLYPGFEQILEASRLGGYRELLTIWLVRQEEGKDLSAGGDPSTVWAERFRDGARLAFEEVLRLHEAHPGARMNLGVLAYRRGRVEDAEAILRQNLEYHPDHLETLEALAVLLVETGRLDEGRALLRRATGWGSESSAAWRLLGDLEFHAGRAVAARKAWTEALRLDEEAGEEGLTRVLILINLDRYAEALETIGRLRRASPDDPGLVFQEARCHDELRNDAEALRLYREYLERTEATGGPYRENAQVRVGALGGGG